MRLKATYLAVGVTAMLALAACGGGDDAPANTTPPAQGSNPPPDNAPAPATSTEAQTQALTTYQYLDTTITGKAATLSFQPNQSTGTLAIGSTNYATLTTDVANDGAMTVGGTPTFGTTLGALRNGAQIMVPSFIETCESVAGDGAPNPAVNNAPTKSTNVFTSGIFVVDGTQLAGRKFTAYYEDCMRDGSATTPATHSSLTIDGVGNETIFDSRTNTTTSMPVTGTLQQASPAGLKGDWIVPYVYVTSTGELRYALIEHGLISAGNTRNFVGVWLEE
jgi:hypothetical protein